MDIKDQIVYSVYLHLLIFIINFMKMWRRKLTHMVIIPDRRYHSVYVPMLAYATVSIHVRHRYWHIYDKYIVFL